MGSRAAGSSGLLFGCLLTVILVSGCGQKSPSEKLADVTEPITSPGWIRFKPEANIDARNFLAGYAEALHLPEGTTMRSVSEETDDLGIAHIRHQQYFRGIEVEGAEFLVHARDARALSANGQLATDFAPKTVAARIEETQALETMRRRMGVNAFYDGDRLVEELKGAPSNPSPRGVLLYTLGGSDNRVSRGVSTRMWIHPQLPAAVRRRRNRRDHQGRSTASELLYHPECDDVPGQSVLQHRSTKHPRPRHPVRPGGRLPWKRIAPTVLQFHERLVQRGHRQR